MKKNINSLVTSVEIDLLRIAEKNSIALNTFKVFISSNKSFFTFSDTPIKTKAYNHETNIEQSVTIHNWKYRKDTLFRNASFLHSISLSLKNELIIAEKTTDGYVTIAASKPELELLLLPFSTNLAYTIENGETYKGKININETDYLISATPLYINGKIEGMLISLQKNEFSLQLSELFGKQIYFTRGYPFAVDKNGILILHPTQPNSSIANTKIFKRILNTQNSAIPVKIRYEWPENANAEDKIMYVKYIPEVKLFIGATYFIDDFKPQLDKLKILLILAVILSTVILSITLIFISNFYSNKNEKIIKILKNLSEGVIPPEYSKIKYADDLPPDAEFVLKYKNLQSFTEHLKKEDYTFDYDMWGENDKVGENLINLNNHLKQNQEKAIEKSKEQEKLIWLNEGMAKFIEILKYQVIEIKELAYKIISQIVEYINANEGGFFILNEENGNKYLELLAAYAMHKKKLLNRKIELGVGFIGRVALEKKTLFLTEIPNSLTKISTALGQGKPKSIVILPLIFNDDIIGVIELSSFEILSDLQLTFLERISENISANLAMWRASQQTADLLKESREQTIVQQEQQKTLQEHLKELENLRENSEQREIELNSIIKAVDTTALLVEYDINGNILSANNRFLSTLERDASEIIGKNHKDVTSMDSNSHEYQEFWKELLNGNTKRFIESFNVLENTIWLSQNYVPIMDKNNKVFKILNIAIDITENKTLERQLRSQVREISKEARTVRREQRKVKTDREEFLTKEKVYLTIIKGVDKYIGHIEFNIDGKIMYINDTFGKFLGLENTSSLINKNIKDLIYSKELETFKLAIENVKKEEEYTSEINFYNSKGNPQELKFSLLPALDTKDNIQKIIMIITIN